MLIQFRLGDHTAKDTLLLSERQEKDELKKALTDTEYKNEELLMKIVEANKKIEHLQNTINMYVPSISFLDIILHLRAHSSPVCDIFS